MRLLDKIKAQVNILREVEKTTKYKSGTGGKHTARCPFHSDREPSMLINSAKGRFRCFGCGARGTVVDWVMERDGLGLLEAAEKLADEYGIAREHDPDWEYKRQVIARNRDKAQRSKTALERKPGPMEYLTKRGLSPETIAHFDLGANDKGDGVVIPIGDTFGSVMGFAIRWTDGRKPKYWNSSSESGFDKGATLYNLHRARRAMKERIFVVEGYFDVFSAHQNSFPETVGLCTARMTIEQANLLGGVCGDGESIVLVPDTCKVGQDACADNILLLASRAPKCPVYVADLPSKDLGDLIADPDGFRDLLERPMGATEWLIRKALKDNPTMDAQMREVEAIAKGVTNPIERDNLAGILAEAWGKDLAVVRDFLGTAKERGRIDPGKLLTIGSSVMDFLNKGDGFHIGFPSIDDNTRGVSGGEVMGIMARSGVGKTTLGLNIARNLILKYPDVPGVFFSMEQQAGPLELRLAQIHFGSSREGATDYLLFGGLDEFQEAFKNLLVCQEGGLTVADLDEYLTLASSRRFAAPIGWMVIDYLGYIAPPSGMTDPYKAASYNAKAVKQLAKKHNAACFPLIQTGRGEKGSGAEPVNFSSARDSGVVEESVDFMLGAWRPSLANPAEIPIVDTMMCRLLKNRNGPPGEVPLTFDTNSLQIYEDTTRERAWA